MQGQGPRRRPLAQTENAQPAGPKPAKQKKRGNDEQKHSGSADAAVPKRQRKSAPEMRPGPPQTIAQAATPVAPVREYNLRSRSSMPAAGVQLTDSSLPTNGQAGLPSSVRPRNPNQKATFSELPVEVLKLVCQSLDPASVLAARAVAVGMREACSVAPIKLRLTVPMQVMKWLPVQIEVWERRVAGVAALLSSGKISSQELQLCMEGAEAWKGEEHMPAMQVSQAEEHLAPLLSTLQELVGSPSKPITHLEMELPITMDTLAILDRAFPSITSLRLDSLIPPPHNHLHALAESRAFSNVRKLDICATAWDQVTYLGSLTQLTDLNIRYSMWNIPELAPLTALQKLETFGLQVVDDRARFQLDFLGPLVRGVPSLRHVRADIILSRTASSDGGGPCEFLAGCGLHSLTLDLRVPQDAARMVQGHFRNLHRAPQQCKVKITIRSDALTRETNFDSAASRIGHIQVPRLGMATPSEPDDKERWGALNMLQGGNSHDPLALLHLRGYRSYLHTLPDLRGALLSKLQISAARMGPADFVALSECKTLEHLWVRFAYQPDTTTSSTFGGAGPSTSSAATASRSVAVGPAARTRSRRSLQSVVTRRSFAPAPPQPDCSAEIAPYVLRPLLELQNLRSLELLEQREPAAVRGDGTRLSNGTAAGGSGAAGPPAARAAPRGAALEAAVGGSMRAQAGVAARQQPQQEQAVVPFSRAGLTHFLYQINHFFDYLEVLSISLLAEEESLPDCPCLGRQCFNGETRSRKPPAPLDEEALRRNFVYVDRWRVALGSTVAADASWYRPSAWPVLD